MSYTRFGQPGKYADAGGIYAYPASYGDATAICIAGRGHVGYGEWAEVTGRILERHTDDEALIEACVGAILAEGESWESDSQKEDNRDAE